MNRIKAVAVTLALLGIGVACDEEPADELARVCVPGTTQACFGPGRCEGAQACLDGGEGFGPCDCGPRPDAGAVDPGPICSPGELRVCAGEGDCGGMQLCGDDATFAACDCSSSVLGVNVLGAACTSDAECGPDLQCWTSAARNLGPYEGGAAHGYCTQQCASIEDCARFDPLGVCSAASAEGVSVCLRGCRSKDPIPGEAKCLDRLDQLCMSTAAFGVEAFDPTARQLGVCLPNCGSDAECDGGRFCDLASGLCVNTAPFGLPIGAACSLDTDCVGQVCAIYPSGARACSAPCPLFSLGCGFALDADPRGAACLVPWLSAGGFTEGQQDLGLCIELCNETSDCNQFGFVCDKSQPTPAGSSGACLPGTEMTVPGVADAGADGG
jgi:hypothetical protein